MGLEFLMKEKICMGGGDSFINKGKFDANILAVQIVHFSFNLSLDCFTNRSMELKLSRKY